MYYICTYLQLYTKGYNPLIGKHYNAYQQYEREYIYKRNISSRNR